MFCPFCWEQHHGLITPECVGFHPGVETVDMFDILAGVLDHMAVVRLGQPMCDATDCEFQSHGGGVSVMDSEMDWVLETERDIDSETVIEGDSVSVLDMDSVPAQCFLTGLRNRPGTLFGLFR
eukprot:gene6269-biopygen13594